MNTIIRINNDTLKMEKENAKALTEGFIKDSKLYYSSIFIAHKKAWSLKNDFRSIPKLITEKRGPNRPEHELSKIGKSMNINYFQLKNKYVAFLDTIFHVNNSIELWGKICNAGIFDIWEPKAPYLFLKNDRQEDKQDAMILLIRIFEIDYDFQNELIPGQYVDIIPQKDVKLLRPIIPSRKDEVIASDYSGAFYFNDIKSLIKENIKEYLREEEKVNDTNML